MQQKLIIYVKQYLKIPKTCIYFYILLRKVNLFILLLYGGFYIPFIYFNFVRKLFEELFYIVYFWKQFYNLY